MTARPSRRFRRYLVFGFALSLLLHVVAGPFLGRMRAARAAETPEVEKLVISKHVRSPPPTPKPTKPPTPPPTPPPEQTPKPHKNPPPQAHLKLNVPKSARRTERARSEVAYVPAPGVENGVPAGHGVIAAPPSEAQTPAPPAPAAPIAEPACAHPYRDAVTKDAVQPEFPDAARERGAQGTAKVRVTLDARGAVLAASIQESTGNQMLDNEALKAAKASTYEPEIVDCRPVGGEYLFSAEFQAQ